MDEGVLNSKEVPVADFHSAMSANFHCPQSSVNPLNLIFSRPLVFSIFRTYADGVFMFWMATVTQVLSILLDIYQNQWRCLSRHTCHSHLSSHPRLE